MSKDKDEKMSQQWLLSSGMGVLIENFCGVDSEPGDGRERATLFLAAKLDDASVARLTGTLSLFGTLPCREVAPLSVVRTAGRTLDSMGYQGYTHPTGRLSPGFAVPPCWLQGRLGLFGAEQGLSPSALAGWSWPRAR